MLYVSYDHKYPYYKASCAKKNQIHPLNKKYIYALKHEQITQFHFSKTKNFCQCKMKVKWND